MSELLNFPFVNQLNSPTYDGKPDANALYNCVAASICAGLRYLTGKMFVPDELKDAAYGEAWVNRGTAASAYVAFCDAQGVRLYPVESTSPQQAIQQAHGYLARGLPVVFTQQDDYAPPQYRNDWTHVCVWYKDTPTTLTAMDPFGAKAIEYSDEVWAQRLRSNELWILEKKPMATIPQGWRDDGTTLTAPNNIPVKLGFRQYILSHNWDAGNVPQGPEYHTDQVLQHNASVGAGQVQVFRDGMFWYTDKAGVVLEPFSGLEIWACYQKIQADATTIQQLQQQIAALQSQVTLTNPAIPTDVIAALKTIATFAGMLK